MQSLYITESHEDIKEIFAEFALGGCSTDGAEMGCHRRARQAEICFRGNI